MTHTSNEIHSLLLNCLTYPVPLGTAEACSALVEAEWQELQEIARIQRISALLHSRLHRFDGGHPDIPPSL